MLEAQCPHCLEPMEVALDPETEGRVVQDCDVCCHPCELVVAHDDEGFPVVRAVAPS